MNKDDCPIVKRENLHILFLERTPTSMFTLQVDHLRQQQLTEKGRTMFIYLNIYVHMEAPTL